MSFQGQHVYVMGGSHGIGEATAGAFAAAGADVVITGRSKERLDALRKAQAADKPQADSKPRGTKK